MIAKSEAVITPPGQVPTSEFVRSPAPVIAEAVKVRVGRVCTRTVSPRCLSSPSYARFVCARNTVSRSRLRIRENSGGNNSVCQNCIIVNS